MKKFFRIIDHPQMYRTAVTLCSLVPLAFGAGWIFVFGFTDYLPHLSRFGIALGIVSVIYGLILFCLYRWAVILSILLSLCLVVMSLISVLSGAWVHIFITALCAFYATVAGRHLFLQWNYTRSQPTGLTAKS